MTFFNLLNLNFLIILSEIRKILGCPKISLYLFQLFN